VVSRRSAVGWAAFLGAFAALAVPAAADPFPPQLAAALTNFGNATSFHVVVDADGHHLEVDDVKPDKMHVYAMGGRLDAIEIGGDSYVKMGSSYRKFSIPGLGDQLSSINSVSDYVNARHDRLTVKDLGTTTVDGASMHAFAVARTSSEHSEKSPSTIYVAADGTIHQITQHTRYGMIVLTFSKYNQPLTIAAPAN
jgi:hypothetical protein